MALIWTIIFGFILYDAYKNLNNFNEDHINKMCELMKNCNDRKEGY